MARQSVVGVVVAELKELIETQHAVGDQLPNEKQLADQLDVSRGSVREALGVLVAEGAVTRSWGVGTFVSRPAPASSLTMSAIQSYRDRVRAVGREVELLEASCEPEPVSPAVAAALGVADGETVWHVTRLFAVDGTPSAFMLEHLPLHLHGVRIDPHPMTTLESDLFDVLDRHVPAIVAHTTTEVEAIAVAAPVAGALGIRAGVPVLRTEQTTVDADGQPLAFGVTQQRTDVLRMRIVR